MAAQIISLIGILIALALIIILSYKGVNLLIVGPLCALVCCLFAWGSIDVVQEGMLTSYASGFGDYAADYFIMFALCITLYDFLNNRTLDADFEEIVKR